MFDHIRLKVRDLAKSTEVYRRANGAPGLRDDYSPGDYAAFLVDFDGNNVEAVCFN